MRQHRLMILPSDAHRPSTRAAGPDFRPAALGEPQGCFVLSCIRGIRVIRGPITEFGLLDHGLHGGHGYGGPVRAVGRSERTKGGRRVAFDGAQAQREPPPTLGLGQSRHPWSVQPTNVGGASWPRQPLVPSGREGSTCESTVSACRPVLPTRRHIGRATLSPNLSRVLRVS